jgi:pyruvate,water dikinase
MFEEKEIDEIEKKLGKKVKTNSNPNLIEKINVIEKEFGKIEYKEMSKEKQEEEQKNLIELLKDLSISVKVNVALPDVAEQAAATNADGVGLLRAEHMITSSGMHPAEFIRQNKDIELKETVKKGIRVVAEKFKGTVWFRTFDARTDEYKELIGGDKEQKEENPMLGWHGIRRDLDEPRMLKAQLMAIKELHEEGLKNLGVMLPFVQSLEELLGAKKIAKEINFPEEIDIGVMVETPAIVWIIEEIIPHIKFVSFGTNDLTQLTLGMDRNNERVQKNFSEMHPAILRQLEYVIKKCKQAGVTTSICGQAASNPEMVKKLVWYGIDSVSANIDAVEEIRKIVIIEEKKKILSYIDKWPSNLKNKTLQQ